MPTAQKLGSDLRVAVYIDFDNVVISRYDQLYNGRWRADNARDQVPGSDGNPVAARLAAATVDIGALLDYASSFGTVALARAYADWSVPANAAYRRQLVDHAVDLIQLFAVSGTKNGADIRLAVDAIEDLLHYDDLTHVLVVAGDSDYIALAQRCKQLGRYVVGIGVTGSTSRALIAACDEFVDYDKLPGVTRARPAETAARVPKSPTGPGEQSEPSELSEPSPAPARTRKATKKRTEPNPDLSPEPTPEPVSEPGPQATATDLLIRALHNAQTEDDDWVYGSSVKSQMQRMDSAFNEKALGFSSFKAFLESRAEVVELRPAGQHVQVRLLG